MRPPIQSERSCRDVEFLAMGSAIGAAVFLGPGPGLHTQNSTVIAAYSLASVLAFAIMRLKAAASGSESARGVTVTFLGAWSGWLAILLAAMAELTAVGVLVHSRLPRVPPWMTELVALFALYGIERLAVRMSPELRFWMVCLKVMMRAAFGASGERKVLAELAVRVLIFCLGTLIAAMIALPPTAIVASTNPWFVAVRNLWPPTLTIMSAVLICALLSSTRFMIRGAAQVLRSLTDSPRTPAPLGSRDVRGGSMALSAAAISVTLILNYYVPARALGMLVTAVTVTIAVSFALFVLRLALNRPPHPPRDRASTPRGDRSTNPPDARVLSSTRRSDHRVTPLGRIRSSDVRRSPC
jgi:L-asparagine transporter-like permease